MIAGKCQVSFIGGIPGKDLIGGWAKLAFASPFANLAVALNLGWLAILLYADSVVSPSGTGLVYEASSARVLYAMPRNGYGPEILRRVHPKFGVPGVALLVSLVIGVAALLPFPAWSKLVGIASTLAIISYILGPISVMVLRRTGPHLHRTVRLKGIHFWSLLGFIAGMLIIYWTSWPNDLYIGIGLGIGLVIYAFYFVRNHLPVEDLRSGVWIVALAAFMVLMSYLGSKSFGGSNLIHYPYDLIVVIVAAVGFFYWGTASGRETKEVREHTAEIEALPHAGD